LQYKELFKLNASLELGLLKATGYLLSKNDIDFKLSDKFNLHGFLNFYRNNQALLINRLYITGQEKWTHNFPDKSILSFGADLEIPILNLSLGIALHNLFNHVYFDELVIPSLLNNNPNILQLKAKHHLKFQNFHFENIIGFQQTAQRELSLPQFLGRHSLYYQNEIFKNNLLIQTGIELHHNDRYSSYTYFPLIDQFYLTEDQTELAYYPFFDAFVSFKVKTFKAFVKAENFNALLSNKVPFQLAEYPQNEFLVRIGINWTMYQ